MALIVQKYGGSSLASAAKIKRVAHRVAEAKSEKYDKVVVVVSAMGKTTNKLIHLAQQVDGHADGRELDVLLSTGELVSSTLLAMALHHMGYEAISLSGAQAGIRTDSTYSRARILKVDPKRVVEELDKGNIVIVAGFQGITDEMDITTLGRGGSDITAVAFAAELHAERCEIYHDVNGVYTADPHLVPTARHLKQISYEELLELASCGSRVIHPRAVELAWIYNVPIWVASSLRKDGGTLISEGRY